MSGPPTSTYAAAAASAAATAAATAKVQRIDLWRQEVAIALSTPTSQDGKGFSRKKEARRNGSNNSNTFPSSSSSSSPLEQARTLKITSFLSRLLKSKGIIGRAGTADGGFGNGNGNDNETPGSRGLLRPYPFESTAMYRSILVPMPPTPTRPRASVMNGGGGNDHGNTENYEGEDGEGSMGIADLNTSSSSSSSPAARLLARQGRLERAARLLGKSGVREGKG